MATQLTPNGQENSRAARAMALKTTAEHHERRAAAARGRSDDFSSSFHYWQADECRRAASAIERSVGDWS